MTLRSWKNLNVGVVAPTFTHPQDYGNRKRLFSFCDALERAGAIITLVHHASELGWRQSVDHEALREASRRWSVFTIPPTRPPHTSPKGDHHLVDEWWDSAIGDYVRWTSRVCSLDVMIVMYPYLSKALEFVPERVYRILDTNDRFSGRKELLEANGIKPEYFYLTEEEELKALKRADLTWAIKEEEAVFFKELGAPAVVALPHVDEVAFVGPKPIEGDVLRVGFIGAANSINIQNISNFLSQSLPLFREYLPPLEIVIGGNISSAFRTNPAPFLRVLGPVKSVQSFYDEIDVAIVPMTFSTGLKIKATEALSLGFPIVAHAHAFEGLPAVHKYHQLQSHEELAMALIDLAFAREELEPLRLASEEGARILKERTEMALNETRALVQQAKRAILYVASDEGAEVGSFACESLISRLSQLSNRAPLYVCLPDTIDEMFLGQLARRVPAARFVLEGCSEEGRLNGTEFSNVFRGSSVADLVDEFRFNEVFLERFPPDPEVLLRSAADQIVVLADQLALSGDEAYREQWPRLGSTLACVVASSMGGRLATELMRAAPDATEVEWPPFWYREFRPLRDLVGRAIAANGSLSLVAAKFDSHAEELCRALSAVHQPRWIRVFGFENRPPVSLLNGTRITFVDIRTTTAHLSEAAGAQLIVQIRSGESTELDGFVLALELLGRKVARLRASDREGMVDAWMTEIRRIPDLDQTPAHFSMKTMPEIVMTMGETGWGRLDAQTPKSQRRGSGVSEIVYNKARRELYVRGYAFDEMGPIEPVLTTATGELHPPLRWMLPRRDLQKRGLEPLCGWDFLLRDVPEGDLRKAITIRSRSDGNDYPNMNLAPRKKAKIVALDFSIDELAIEPWRQKLVVRGRVGGEHEALTEGSLTLEGIALGEPILTIDRPETAGPADSLPFVLEANLRTRVGGVAYQLFPSVAQTVVISVGLDDPSSEYVLIESRPITAEEADIAERRADQLREELYTMMNPVPVGA